MSGKKISAQFTKQPQYYDNFSCIGGSCPMSCCLLWRVDWTNDEVEKLRNAECSDSLRELIDTSFKKYDDKKYIIIMDDKKRCPFLTEDNFCSIQRELGEEYLSKVCRTYPRQSFANGNEIVNYCNLSCYRIMDTLCNDSECMILEKHSAKSGKIILHTDSTVDTINHPELKYRPQLLEFFYDIIADDSCSLETSIVLGALAASSITKLIAKGSYDRIPEHISAFKKQINDPQQIAKIEAIKPNDALRFGFGIRLNRMLINSNITDNFKDEDGTILIEKYLEGEKKFAEAFADRPFVLRNIALNFLLEFNMPFRDKDHNLFENFCYYAAAVALIKFVGSATYIKKSSQEQDFKTVSSYVSRSFAHDNIRVKTVLDVLNEFHCTSPAYLSLIMK